MKRLTALNIILGAAMICLSTSSGSAQDNLVNGGSSARNASLANANIAESNDISSMYENPASLSFLQRGSLVLNHAQIGPTDGMEENIAIPVISRWAVDVSMGVDVFHHGYVGASVPDSMRILQYAYDLTVSGAVTPAISLGGSAIVVRGEAGGASQAWALSYSFGVSYIPGSGVSYGLVVGGIGQNVTYPSGDMVPAARPTEMDRTLTVGATMRYPTPASLRPPFIIVSFANQKVFGTTGLYYMGGVEVRPIPALGLRVGYLVGPGTSSARCGAGFHVAAFSMDFALCSQGGSGPFTQQVSAALDL